MFRIFGRQRPSKITRRSDLLLELKAPDQSIRFSYVDKNTVKLSNQSLSKENVTEYPTPRVEI